MSIEEYWNIFKKENNVSANKYDSFSFYDDDLLNLVLEGKKNSYK